MWERERDRIDIEKEKKGNERHDKKTGCRGMGSIGKEMRKRERQKDRKEEIEERGGE